MLSLVHGAPFVSNMGTTPGVAFITIDHPPVNLLDAKLMMQIDRFVSKVADDRDIRVVVFQSADTEFFIVHGDMNFVTDPESLASVKIGGDEDAALNPMQWLHECIRCLPQVTIGKLAGRASGGGAEFLEAMDMRFVARGHAGLAQNEVLTGLIPGACATAYLPRLMGRARTLEAILGAALFDADSAERYGWINRALPAEALDGFVDELARHIAALPPGVIAAAKTAVNAAESPIVEALRVQNEQIGSLFKAPIVVELNKAALNAGAQTREGERELDRILRHLQS